MSRNQPSQNISQFYGKLVSEMQKKIDSLSHFSLCIDFWSKNTTGFLGITLNFLNGKKMNSMLLTLKQVDFPHTCQVVLLETNNALECWKIQGVEDPRITYILTDNGSNMVKAYSEIGGLLANPNDPSQPANYIDSDTFEFDEFDSDDECDSDGDDLQNMYPKRLPCVAHCINDTIKTSIQGSVRAKIDRCSEMVNLLTKVKGIMNKIQYSGLCADYMRKENVYTYLPPQTRWIYQFKLVSLIDTVANRY